MATTRAAKKWKGQYEDLLSVTTMLARRGENIDRRYKALRTILCGVPSEQLVELLEEYELRDMPYEDEGSE